MIYVIKKDGTKEEFNAQKIVAAGKKRILSAVLPRNMHILLEKKRLPFRKCIILWKELLRE